MNESFFYQIVSELSQDSAAKGLTRTGTRMIAGALVADALVESSRSRLSILVTIFEEYSCSVHWGLPQEHLHLAYTGSNQDRRAYLWLACSEDIVPG